jgi:prophage regulatory protein
MNHPKQLIDKRELTRLVKYSPQHIARLEKAGQFPKRIRLGQTRGEKRLCRDRE